MVGVKSRSIQIALASLEKHGIISRRIEHERNGVRGTWRSVQIHYVLGGRTTVSLGRVVDKNGAQPDSDGAHFDDGDGAHHEARGATSPDALQKNTPRFEHSHITQAVAVVRTPARDDDGGEPFESISTATLPAQTKPAIPAGLSALASQLGPIAENWLWSHVTSGTSPNDWRLATVLHETAGMNIRSPKLLEMKFNDLPETKPAPAAEIAVKPGVQSTPGRILSKDKTRVSLDGGKTWVDVKTPMPNMPHWSQEPPPRLDWSNGNHKSPGMPLGGLLGKRVVETTVAEQPANGDTLAARETELAENLKQRLETKLKNEAEAAARKELHKRRHKRMMELVALGKNTHDIGDILREEGLAE